MTYFTNGAIPTSQLEAIVPRIGYKTSVQTVNNSTTLVSDSQLFVTVAANTNYLFTGRIRFTTGATPDFKFGFTFPTGATATYTLYGIGAGGATLNIFNLNETSVAALEGGTAIGCTMSGSWSIASSSGTVQLQWAQNAADPSNTQVLANSWIRLDQVVAT